jgi:hypothetical protein
MAYGRGASTRTMLSPKWKIHSFLHSSCGYRRQVEIGEAQVGRRGFSEDAADGQLLPDGGTQQAQCCLICRTCRYFTCLVCGGPVSLLEIQTTVGVNSLPLIQCPSHCSFQTTDPAVVSAVPSPLPPHQLDLQLVFGNLPWHAHCHSHRCHCPLTPCDTLPSVSPTQGTL